MSDPTSDPGDVLLGASLNLMFASITSLISPSDDDNLHLNLAQLHATQSRFYSLMQPEDVDSQQRVFFLQAIHFNFEQLHKGIDQRTRAMTGTVIQTPAHRHF